MANEEHKHDKDECFEECEDICAPVKRQARHENASTILIIALVATAIAATFALFATGIIILDQDKEIVNGPPGQNGSQGPAGPAGPQGPPGNNATDPEPEENECPDRARDGRTQSEKDANKDATTWQVVPMTDEKYEGEFKIVDDKGINVADKFNNEENAQKYIDHKLCKQANK